MRRESCVRNLTQARLPPSWWGYAWDDGEEAAALTPDLEPPHHCPDHKIKGHKVKGAHRRPFGCLAYVPDPRKGAKVDEAAGGVPAINLGYGLDALGGKPFAPCYHCWAPSLGKIVRESTVRFVPTVFPGICMQPTGGVGSILRTLPQQQDYAQENQEAPSEQLLPENAPYIDVNKLPSGATALEWEFDNGGAQSRQGIDATGHPLVDGDDSRDHDMYGQPFVQSDSIAPDPGGAPTLDGWPFGGVPAEGKRQTTA